MNEGSFKKSVAAIETALATHARRFVPGHGGVGARENLKAYQTYLSAIHAAVKPYADSGYSNPDMNQKIAGALAPYRHWVGFEHELPRHVVEVYQEIQAEAP
jgi:hypothetical protein